MILMFMMFSIRKGESAGSPLSVRSAASVPAHAGSEGCAAGFLKTGCTHWRVSEGSGRQILAVERDNCALATVRIRDFLDVELEVDRADDAVAKLFVDERLQRRAVDLDHFVEAIDRWICRYPARDAAAQRNGLKKTRLLI